MAGEQGWQMLEDWKVLRKAEQQVLNSVANWGCVQNLDQCRFGGYD